MKKNIIVLITLVVSYINGISQTVPSTLAERVESGFSISDYIFEAEGIDDSVYHKAGTSNQDAYTVTTLRITKIFKNRPNDLQCGTIKVVTKGGLVDIGGGVIIFVGRNSEANMNCDKNFKGVFFAMKNGASNHPVPPYNGTDNNFFLEPAYWTAGISYGVPLGFDIDAFVNELKYPIASGFGELEFQKIREVYDFIKANHYIDSLNIIDCGGVRTINTINEKPILKDENIIDIHKEININTLEESKQRRELHDKVINDRMIQKKSQKNQKSASLIASIDISFANEKISKLGTTKYFEFDIMISASTTGTFLENCPIRIQYNSSSFGDSVLNNAKLTITKGLLFNSTSYDNPQILSKDVNSNKFVALLGLDYTLSSFSRTEVPTSPTQLLHLKMQFPNCNQPTDISITDFSITSFVSIFTLTPNEPLSGSFETYDAVNYSGNMFYNLCEPIVTYFTPAVDGGVYDTMFIEGKFFGASQGNGRLVLRNANSAGGNISYNDPFDFAMWSDNLIKYVVPQINDTTYTIISGNKLAGSGIFYLGNDFGGNYFSGTPLIIRYSAIQYSLSNHTPLYKKYRLNLVKTTSSNISYLFHCDTSISNYPYLKAIVQKAIDYWNCETNINWSLGNDTIWQAVGNDGINIIYMDNSFPTSGFLAQTLAFTDNKNYGQCNSADGTKQYIFYRDIDIVFRKNLSTMSGCSSCYWWTDTTNADVPANAYDFYEVILHELGHAHNLDHVNQLDDLMFASTNKGPRAAGTRRINYWNYANIGGGYMAIYSKFANYNASCIATNVVLVTPPGCSSAGTGIFQSDDNKLEFVLYPNPTQNDEIILQYTSDEINNAVISIIDIQGKLISTFSQDFQLGENRIKLKLDNISSGNYFVKIKNKNQEFTQPFIKL